MTVNGKPQVFKKEYTIDGREVDFKSPPPSDSLITIARQTATERLVSWADASVLKAADLTLSQVQQLHIIEESQDWSRINSIVQKDGVWDARSSRIVNLADPIEDNNAVTKGYMHETEKGFIKQNETVKADVEKLADQVAADKVTTGNLKNDVEVLRKTTADIKDTAITARDSAIIAQKGAETALSQTNAIKNRTQEIAVEAQNSANACTDMEASTKTSYEAVKGLKTEIEKIATDVNVFVPSTNAEGYLSWTNKAGLPNPPPFKIKGEKGEKGDPGKAEITEEDGMMIIQGTLAYFNMRSPEEIKTDAEYFYGWKPFIEALGIEAGSKVETKGGKNGWHRTEDGLLIQWGINDTAQKITNFPIAFTEQCYVVLPVGQYRGDGPISGRFYCLDGNPRTTDFSVLATSSTTLNWIAIGR